MFEQSEKNLLSTWFHYAPNSPECMEDLKNYLAKRIEYFFAKSLYLTSKGKTPRGMRNFILGNKTLSLEYQYKEFLTNTFFLQKYGQIPFGAFKQELLKSCVMLCTGPYALCHVLFQSFYASKEELNKMAPFSFLAYGLATEFCIESSGFHMTLEDLKKWKQSLPQNDLSWLPIGMANIQKKEQTMNKAAGSIQTFFRSCQAKNLLTEALDKKNNMESSDTHDLL